MSFRWLPRFQEAYRAIQVLEQQENWSRAELESFQLERLNRLWAHARSHVPFYRQLADRLHLPEHFRTQEEFSTRMPVLRKTTVRDSTLAFYSQHAEIGKWVRTGGSTGTPMSAYWGSRSHREMLWGRYRLLASWGLDLFDPTVFLWGHHHSYKSGVEGWLDRIRQPVEDWMRNRLRLSAYRLGKEDLRGYLKQIAEFRPSMIYAYSRALALLAEEAEACGFTCDSLRLAIVTSEPACPHLIQTIQRAFQVPAVVEYGTVECGFLAGEGPDRTLRVRENRVLLETLPRADGQYDIVLTLLDNPSFPLLRYEVGDITDTPLERPARGLAILKNVMGRNNDFVACPTGRLIHSTWFDVFFKDHTRVVRRFRVHQKRDGALRVELELNDPAAVSEVPGMQRKLLDLVEGYPVQVEVVNTIPLTVGGKQRLVVSELDETVFRGNQFSV